MVSLVNSGNRYSINPEFAVLVVVARRSSRSVSLLAKAASENNRPTLHNNPAAKKYRVVNIGKTIRKRTVIISSRSITYYVSKGMLPVAVKSILRLPVELESR